MFGFKKKPRTKKLEDFELLELNLIKDLPIDYAYVMPQSKRVIQKRNKEELDLIVKNDLRSIEYIKMGPDSDFVHIEAIREIRDIVLRQERKKVKDGLIVHLILIAVFIGVSWYEGNVMEFLKSSSFRVIFALILFQNGFAMYKFLKIKGDF